MRTVQQILKDMQQTLISSQVSQIQPGSVIDTILQAAAQSDYERQEPIRILLSKIEAQEAAIAKLQEDFMNYILLEKKEKQ